mmetsp:Transcript_73662/g.116659  ORF Transcript_73662/g.116659 Transcript_73662/m.116659 type:complete len:334 (-) Transcript_73662:80-1081(-)|eukprot:CAMPEP_0169150708 /NCGR_PEP_ID=MMETSP1015-20121227/50353_1 /TAXON_ID=342587 /ORGANISM="Karlodinium micrum, Strain CCMP2283" /LENGTH=333 /DNA_ID=CAMNT_0009219911 /DNA_START=46 /DNA_END=1047 /DNA_ORIENTATION=+
MGLGRRPLDFLVSAQYKEVRKSMAVSPPSPQIVSGLVSGSIFSRSVVSRADFFMFIWRVTARRHEDSEMIQMMESMTGVVAPKSVTAAQLCRFLKDTGFLAVGRCNFEGLNEMMFARRTWRSFLGLKVSIWWRKVKAMFIPRSWAIQMYSAARERTHKAIKAKLKDEEKSLREEVEAFAAARQPPARPTDSEVSVVFQLEDRMSMSRFELSISKEDTFDDVYSRAIVNRRHEISGKVFTNERDALRHLEEQKQFREAYGDPMKRLHKAEYQPDWLVVQKGAPTSKKGFVITDLSAHVSDFDIEPEDILHFISAARDSVQIFFRTYSRNEAKDA